MTIDGAETCKVAIQTNKVEVDDDGLTYYAEPVEVRPILPIDTPCPVPQTVVTERKRHPTGVGATRARGVFGTLTGLWVSRSAPPLVNRASRTLIFAWSFT